MNWNILGQLENNGVAGPLVGKYNNYLIIGGGANFPDKMPWNGGQKSYHNELYIYAKRQGEFVLELTHKLPFETAYGASCSLSNGIVYIGGEDANGPSDAVVFIKLSEYLEPIIQHLPDLPMPTSNGMATLIGSTVYFVGGNTSKGITNSAYYLNLQDLDKGWQSLTPLPLPISHAVVQSINGSIYLLGGRTQLENGLSKFLDSVYEFNIKSSKWIIHNEQMPYALSAGPSITIDNHKIVLLGGDRGFTFEKVESLIQAISFEPNDKVKNYLNKQKVDLQTNHPGFSNEILVYDTLHNSFSIGGYIPFSAAVTTTALNWSGDIIIPSGETKAGIRSSALLYATAY